MRSFLWAIGIVVLPAAMAGAQLLNSTPKATNNRDTDKNRPAAGSRDIKTEGGKRDAGPPRANAMFVAIDVNGDGVITKIELRKSIKALQTLDTDGDGSITLAEANVGGGPAGPAGAGLEDPQVAQLMGNDINGDGKLTANEVPAAMLPMLQGADQNRDQAIDRQELAAAMANARNQFGAGPGGPWNGRGPQAGGARNADPDDITGQFLQNDKNGDGRLSPDELPPEGQRMLRRADRNNDGALDAGELQAALRQLGDRARLEGFQAGGEGNNIRNRAADRARDRGQN